MNLSFTLAAGFGTLDWLVVGAYLILLLVSGIYFARKEPAGSDEYFLAGRRMPAWAVACSILASTLSVATFVGVPEQTYKDAGNLTYLATNIGGFLAILVVAFVFIPRYFRENVTTVYELLDRRFGHNAKRAASATFMVGRVFASGARVYIAAIPLAMLLFGPENSKEPAYLIGAITVLTIVAVLYTLVGGIASVIYTDVIQTVVLLGAILAGVFLLWLRIPASAADVLSTLAAPTLQTPAGPITGPSKLILFDLSLDLTKDFTLMAALGGFTLINLAAYGTDHDMAQRMLTCKNAVQGGRSAIAAICMGVPVVALFLIVGLLLFVFYKCPQLMGAAAPSYQPPDKEVLLTFILREFPGGLSGLMVAGLFAVGLGSLNSAINAMAATFVKDFYIPFNPTKTESHFLAVSRWAVAGWGIILGLFAILCIFWVRSNPDTTLLGFALGVMTFAYSGLLAVFLCAIFTRRGNGTTACLALAAGFAIVVLLQPVLWVGLARLAPGLFPPPIRVGGSGGGILDEAQFASAPVFHTAATIRQALPMLKLAFPWHMVIGTTIAFLVCFSGRPRPYASAQK